MPLFSSTRRSYVGVPVIFHTLALLAFTTRPTMALGATGSRSEDCSPIDAVFHDVHDGDFKRVQLDPASGLKITPVHNDQAWVVQTEDVGGQPPCAGRSFAVDFRVPDKPSPPPVALAMRVMRTEPDGALQMQFLDPTGTISPNGNAAIPVNVWTETPDVDERPGRRTKESTMTAEVFE